MFRLLLVSSASIRTSFAALRSLPGAATRLTPKIPTTPNTTKRAISGMAFATGTSAVMMWLLPSSSSEPLPSSATKSNTDLVPPFSLDKNYFDDATYWGRVGNMNRLIDASLLLVSEEELSKAKAMIEEFMKRNGKLPEGVSDEQMWRAKQIVNGIIHPVTGEKMIIVGRMSAFVPLNIPIVLGMLLHGPTSPAAAAFWQFINQSVNAACNYANRSGAAVDWTSISSSYALAIATSCGMAFGSGEGEQTKQKTIKHTRTNIRTIYGE
eukprot:c20733_g1_i5.p1 GENE.c20733_g1_i5~~c20733_g1_i5.p1  ORF type:complete len:277 (+),score=58.43 c20733_g1_i5:31-831(+)